MPSAGRKVRSQKLGQCLCCRKSADILQIVSRRDSIANPVHTLKSFILLPAHSSDCTIPVAAQLLFRPGTTLPALPDFVIPGRETCSNGVSSFRLFVLQTPDN
jgi:hypothetical protein